LTVVGLLAFVLGVLSARPACAEITFVSASGPGGTVSNLGITTLFTANDGVNYDANFTALGPIRFTLTIDAA
jgi:hypothetical protein